jgi:hypothetical protein
MVRDASHGTVILKAVDPLDPIEWNTPLGASRFVRRPVRAKRILNCCPTYGERFEWGCGYRGKVAAAASTKVTK